MANIEMNVDYFINTEKDGNLSLETPGDRIRDAIRLFEHGNAILLTDLNKIVTNERELRDAIEEKLKTKEL